MNKKVGCRYTSIPATRPSFHDMRIESVSFPRSASLSHPYCTSHFEGEKFGRADELKGRLARSVRVPARLHRDHRRMARVRRQVRSSRDDLRVNDPEMRHRTKPIRATR